MPAKKIIKKIALSILVVIALLIVAGFFWLKHSNDYQLNGTIEIEVNDDPITIYRDAYGISYVMAESKADAIRGQGFVEAQDRLFQIEFYRLLFKGELAKIIGPSMVQSDIKMRIFNIPQKAKEGYKYLNSETKDFLKWYCEGYNAYLKVGQGEFPKELALLKIKPSPLTPIDVLSAIHFVGLTHARNFEQEILSLNLNAHFDKAEALTPLNVNPDRTKPLQFPIDSLLPIDSEQLSFDFVKEAAPFLSVPELGSNNWAISGKKSKSGKAILSNDPHLDARLLPGVFYPVGLICPEFNSVGISIPGIPGLICGRNDFVAFGVTNGYGDSQDLFIEQVDGEQYLHEGSKRALETRKETILVKDTSAVELTIRSTVRGPILSDFEQFGILTKDVVSFRSSQAYSKNESLGIERMLEAKNINEFRAALNGIDNMFFNFVMADTEGGIAHQATGLIPKRALKQGYSPQQVGAEDTWLGFVPSQELPHMKNPERGWVGTANHDTRPDNYPYYYSSHFSPNYRYARIKEVLSQNKRFDADDMKHLVLDCKNLQAVQLTPLFVSALEKDEKTKNLATILRGWNYEDRIDLVAPTVYHTLYHELADLVLNDELPDSLEEMYWSDTYYWQQRLDSMLLSADHPFIDNVSTPKKEALQTLIIDAGIKAKQFLSETMGPDTAKWVWGEAHFVAFLSPIRQEGFGSTFLGRERFGKYGSNQTLNRGGYVKRADKSFETSWISTFRMVADLNDDEKLMGVLAGGSAARMLHPHYKSQLETWKNGEWIPYWLKKEKVVENAMHELQLQ